MVPHSLWRWLLRNRRDARALVRRATLERLENRSLLDIRFAVIGDYGTRSEEETIVANMVRDWNPDFVTTTGDNSYSGDYAADVGFHYGEFIDTTFATTRFFPAMGNHEAPNFTDYFSVPNSNYEVSRGPADFFFIDSEQMLGGDPSQATWLQGRLAASTKPFQFVFVHRPPYSSGSVHGSHPQTQLPYAEWGADAVFSGDDHLYERLEVDGIPYFVNGAGGAPLYGFSTPLPESRARFSYHGAMLVHVTDTEVTTGFYAIGGVLPLDSFPGPSSVVPPVHVLEIQVANSNAQLTGYAIPTGSGEQLTRVPVARPDQISLLFSGRAFTDENDLAVRGLDHGSYTVVGFEEREGAVAGTWQATWTLSQPLAADFVEVVLDAGVGDQFGRRIDGEWQNPRRASETSSDSLPTGDGLPGGEFRFRFTVLPGDATRDNRIDEADLAAVARNYGLHDDGATFAEGDFDGNGAVGLGDLVILRSNLREDRTAWNHLPGAMPDAYVADFDTLLSVPAPGVLLNDSDPDSDAMEAILTRGPEHGELIFNADGSFSYQPFPEHVGPDSFAYRAFDGFEYSGETVVSLSTRPGVSVLRVSVVEDENDGDLGPSDLSLREAIVLANSIGGHTTIHVPAGRYELSLPAIAGDNGNDAAYGDLDLTDSVTLIGDGPDRTVIDAESRYRVFESLWVGQTNVVIELRGLTVEGGNAEFGGGIQVYGPITITITDCLLRNNHASEYGGGLLFDGGAMVRLMNSTVTGNTAAGFGGGIFNGSGTSLTLINTTVSGNTAQNGGAIHLFELGNPSTLVIQSSTIAYNTATTGPDGGISTHEGQAQFAGPFLLKNSILAKNSGHDFYGNLHPASEYSWIGVGDRMVGGPTDGQYGNRIGTLAAPLDPRLAPLGNNGGSTPTHVLLPDSPLIDAGNPAFDPANFDPPLLADQRGLPRVADGNGDGTARIDIGAVEFQNAPPAAAAVRLGTVGRVEAHPANASHDDRHGLRARPTRAVFQDRLAPEGADAVFAATHPTNRPLSAEATRSNPQLSARARRPMLRRVFADADAIAQD